DPYRSAQLGTKSQRATARCAEYKEVSMSRIIVGLSAAAFIFASSQMAFADENGLVTGAVGGAVAGAVVGGPVGPVVGGVGGAAIGNSVTNHRSYSGVTRGSENPSG